MSYLDISADLTKRSEDCKLVGYPDSNGIPTDGWGNTGPEVKIGQHISQEKADLDFVRNQAHADQLVQKRIKPAAWAALSDHQKAALVDFVFNTGANPDWQTWKVVNTGKLDLVPAQLRRFNKGHIHGKDKPAVVIHGLDRRRDAEVHVWLTGDTVVAGQIAKSAPIAPPSSAVTRTIVTPPTPDTPKTLKNASLGAKAGTLVTGCCAYVVNNLPDLHEKAKQAQGIVSDNAASLGHFGSAAVSVFGAATICLGLAALVIHHDQQRAAKL